MTSPRSNELCGIVACNMLGRKLYGSPTGLICRRASRSGSLRYWRPQEKLSVRMRVKRFSCAQVYSVRYNCLETAESGRHWIRSWELTISVSNVAAECLHNEGSCLLPCRDGSMPRKAAAHNRHKSSNLLGQSWPKSLAVGEMQIS